MKHFRTFHSIALAGAAVLTLSAGTALAEFPERNIENVFPWGPGSAMAATQIISEAMGDELGVNIAVVSTPGAAGVKAFQTALDKPADGYTIIDGWVAPLVLQPMIGNGDWTYEDFETVMRTARRRDGRALDPMMPTEAVTNMDDTERRALWEYLRSVPPTPSGQR